MSRGLIIWCNSSSTNEPYVYVPELTLHYILLPDQSLTFLFLKHTQNARNIFSGVFFFTTFHPRQFQNPSFWGFFSHTAGWSLEREYPSHLGSQKRPWSSQSCDGHSCHVVGTACPLHLSSPITVTYHGHISNSPTIQ